MCAVRTGLPNAGGKWVLCILFCLLPLATVLASVTFEIVNNNAAGVGFNDTTPAAPVGGNTGTTLGEQRLIAFQYAAAQWGSLLNGSVTIRVGAQFAALSCTATTATFGSASATEILRDFMNSPQARTWYVKAEANQFAQFDLDPAKPDIMATFNVNLGYNANCLPGTFFYLGLDNQHGSSIDLVTLLLHELAHGLGLASFTNLSTGAGMQGYPTIYDYFLHDDVTNKNWPQMTDVERKASAINARHVAWTGANVQAAAAGVLAKGYPRLTINTPGAIAGNYEVGAALFGPPLSSPGVTTNVVIALDPADGPNPSTTDACSVITNPAAVTGNVALVDRGSCNFNVQVKNVQDAGAVAAIVVDSASGGTPPSSLTGVDATIHIPSIRISNSDGAAIKAQLPSGVNVTLTVDKSRLAGANAAGQPLIYASNPLVAGATISHWDTLASPNLLMEPPPVNAGLTHSVLPPQDLTLAQMRDIGWSTAIDVFDRIFMDRFDGVPNN